MHPTLHTKFCDQVGVQYPIVQTGMGWVATSSLVAGTANAGGLGILASAVMDMEELRSEVAEIKRLTNKPFAVNMRADATDIEERVDFLIEQGVKVASFAQAPKQKIIERCKSAGVFVMPSIGARRHAEKVLDWGVDAVLVQGGEGGGHTGSVPTSILLPDVIDAVAGKIPVIAAGGFFNGRGLVAALAYGADGIAMGTRFLLTKDSTVPDVIKQFYLQQNVQGTVVSTQVDGVPHRVLRTELVEFLESGRGRLLALPRAALNALKFRKMTGTPMGDMLREGLEMRKALDLTFAQMLMAANTPMLLKATMIDGNIDAGVMASGQVVGVIKDLPTCDELIQRIVDEAETALKELGA
ncbi:MAG: nitronate monooxygenase [Actinobacteria bacterium]|nr:nitronate monooxygenase [Actinomycetota bacterium]